jgi:biotin operon repressor
VNFVETSKVAVVEEEVGGTDATVGLRKNAIEKKFAVIASLLDDSSRYNYVSTATLAAAMGVDESTVPNYISAFRKKYPAAEISARRGRGYYRDCSQSLLAMVGVTVSTVVHRVEMPVDTGMFMGLEQSTISYFQERAMDLAS